MSGHSKWANIKRKKGKNDALRGRVTTKIGREITIAVRMGGADLVGNMRLKLALQKAKENNVPKENIQRAIQKGAGMGEGGNYEEITYEGYGPAGVAITVEVMTDNRNRTAADVRHVFTKSGGNMGETGCVAWMFKRKGIFVVEKECADEEELMMISLDAGAEDFKTGEDEYEIITTPEDYDVVEKAFLDKRVPTVVSKITKIPDTTIELDESDSAKLERMLDAMDELDDVQDVYHNGEMQDEE